MAVIRKRPLGILSGFDPVLPDSLDKTKYKNTLTVPDLVDMLNKYQITIQQIEDIRTKLENHINDVNNPHKTTFDPSTFNVTSLLYKEYKEKFNYTGSFEEFLSILYDTIERATPSDLSDPIVNKDKFATLEVVEALVESHNSDSNAHQNIINQIHGGEVFNAHPKHILSNKPSALSISDIIPISSSDIYVQGYNSLFTEIPAGQLVSHYWNHRYPSFLLFKQRTNYVKHSETFDNPILHGLVKDTSNSYIPNLRGSYNYTVVKESGDNVERYIQSSVDNVPSGWITVSFYYYPIIRDIFQISLNNNVVIKAQLSTNEFEVISNTTGKPLFFNILECVSGYYRICITFYNNFGFNSIKIMINDYYDDDFKYIANTEYPVGIFYQLQVEDTTIASPPIITQSSTVTKGTIDNIVSLYKLRSLVQGTMLIEIEQCNLTDTLAYIFDCQVGSNRLKCYIQNYQLVLETTIQENSYVKQVTPANFPLRVCMSYGPGGVIYGIENSIWILGDNSFTEVAELDILTHDVNNISETNVLDLSKFPYVGFKSLNNLNKAMDNVMEYLLQHLTVNREEDIAVVTSPLGIQTNILGVDRFPDTSDKIALGSNLDNSYHADAYINTLLVYDIAANKEQVRYLLNKHYTPYSPF